MTTVTCVGIAVQDVIFRLDRLPSGPGKNHASSRLEVGGGVAANAAVAISRLGGRARYIGALGDDETGNAVLEGLTAEGVDVSAVRLVPEARSPLSAIAVDEHGDRLIINHTDPSVFDRAAPPSPDELSGSDAVLTDVRWPAGAAAALAWATTHDKPGVIDYDVGNRPAGELLVVASHVVFGSQALLSETSLKDPAAALTAMASRTSSFVAVTAGEDGAYWLDDGGMRHFDAFDVEVEDTTGAGDVFHGAFALRLAAGRGDMEETIRYASAAAAFTCMTFGGRSGMPTADQLAQFMEGRR